MRVTPKHYQNVLPHHGLPPHSFTDRVPFSNTLSTSSFALALYNLSHTDPPGPPLHLQNHLPSGDLIKPQQSHPGPQALAESTPFFTLGEPSPSLPRELGITHTTSHPHPLFSLLTVIIVHSKLSDCRTGYLAQIYL